jgi:hypothetical protein
MRERGGLDMRGEGGEGRRRETIGKEGRKAAACMKWEAESREDGGGGGDWRVGGGGWTVGLRCGNFKWQFRDTVADVEYVFDGCCCGCRGGTEVKERSLFLAVEWEEVSVRLLLAVGST